MIFRYPGSKKKHSDLIIQKMAPFIKDSFTDVFVGGGSILCRVAELYPNIRLTANDLDENIFSFWKIVERNKASEILSLFSLLEQVPTVELFNELRAAMPLTMVEKAYHAIFFNRTTFSGIFKSSPIGGFSQSSKWDISCRYNSEAIKKKVFYMTRLFDGRLGVENKDFSDVLSDGAMYLDPPYYEKGEQLYPIKMTDEDHVRLSMMVKKHSRWLLSYDDCDEIRSLYMDCKIWSVDRAYSISGKKNKWAQKKELFIMRK